MFFLFMLANGWADHVCKCAWLANQVTISMERSNWICQVISDIFSGGSVQELQSSNARSIWRGNGESGEFWSCESFLLDAILVTLLDYGTPRNILYQFFVIWFLHICLQILSCKYLTALCCETRLLLALRVIGGLRVDSNYLSSWFWYIAMNFMLLLYFIFFISCHLIAWGSKVFKTDQLEYCSLCSLNSEICFWIQIYNASLDA